MANLAEQCINNIETIVYTPVKGNFTHEDKAKHKGMFYNNVFNEYIF